MWISGAEISVAINVTTFLPLATGQMVVSTTEANRKTRYRTAGTLSNFHANLSSNTFTLATTTIRVRKGGANGSGILTFNAGVSGTQEDTTNTDTIAAGDDLDIQIATTNSGANTIIMQFASIVFTPTNSDLTVTKMLNGHALAFATANITDTRFFGLCGALSTRSTETEAQLTIRHAATHKNMWVFVSSNARANTTIFKSRKNASNGTMSCTFTSTLTGLQEDTSNSDSLVAGDEADYTIQSGSGTSTLTLESISSEFHSTAADANWLAWSEVDGSTTAAANATSWLNIAGRGSVATVETKRDFPAKFGMVAHNLCTNVPTNGVTVGNSTFKVKIGSALSAITTTYAASATGVQEDTTNYATINAGDNIKYEITAGTVGTTITFRGVGVGMSTPPTVDMMMMVLNSQGNNYEMFLLTVMQSVQAVRWCTT